MDKKAYELLVDYIRHHLDMKEKEYTAFSIWKSKILHHIKWVFFCTGVADALFEVVYNSDKKEWYVDMYQKRGHAVYSMLSDLCPLPKADSDGND